MKSEIKTPSKEIVWHKRQLVKSTITSAIILTSGEHSDDSFCGTVVNEGRSDDEVGIYFNMWKKAAFIPATDTVELSND